MDAPPDEDRTDDEPEDDSSAAWEHDDKTSQEKIGDAAEFLE